MASSECFVTGFLPGEEPETPTRSDVIGDDVTEHAQEMKSQTRAPPSGGGPGGDATPLPPKDGPTWTLRH